MCHEFGRAWPDRRRQSTANRVLNVLKAALNHAFDEGYVKSNVAWGRRLKPFKKAASLTHLSVASRGTVPLKNSQKPC
jgi:hypothetical protein